MERMTGKPISGRGQSVSGRSHLGLGSSFAAGALMLGHMNSQGLGRYDKLIADLSRLNSPPARAAATARASKSPPKRRIRWVSWLYR